MKKTISDELLAAYLEGNTTPEETSLILSALEHDEQLREILITAERVDCMLDNEATEYTLLPMEHLAAKERDSLCDFQCEVFILGKLGIDVDPVSLSEEARFNKWLKEKGTPLHNVGRLLQRSGLSVVRRYHATIADLQTALERQRQVIVVVNAEKLYGGAEKNDSAVMEVHVVMGGNAISYHALAVQQVDTKKETVSVFDPATSSALNMYPIEAFTAAWDDALAYMVCASSKCATTVYEPHPIELNDVELTDELLELREAIAENAHEVWAAARIKEGWTYGPARSDTNMESPDLIPYSDLPDSEKQYDRDMAMSAIKLVRKLGYVLIKFEDTDLHRSLMGRIHQHGSYRCKECGAPIFKDQVFCERCGKKLVYTDFVE
jgi:hypothetical protein